ncbi:hypothetical protein SDC9_204832 [bioreactor metagenome]|uniref:PEP-utilising enzyme C-terminal domain-containing protein n=1 Tax=bioreactor metagenome TaxID=1076179 RepID=A0A645J0C9_9ZZZZ
MLLLVADVIAAGAELGKSVSVCGEVAGDVTMTRLLLGLGLRSFSMHPAQILADLGAIDGGRRDLGPHRITPRNGFSGTPWLRG